MKVGDYCRDKLVINSGEILEVLQIIDKYSIRCKVILHSSTNLIGMIFGINPRVLVVITDPKELNNIKKRIVFQ
jgi:hypothetical protein